MTELTKGIYAGATSEMVGGLLQEFIDELGENLPDLGRAAAPGQPVDPLRRFAFETKGQAHNFGLTLLHVVASRMEDFASAIDTITDDRAAALSAFLDAISDILDGTLPPDSDPSVVARSLPARPATFDIDDIEVRDVEVMLVMLHGAQTHFVERELHECGYRVSIVTSTQTALDLIIRTKPDMVIISAVMPGLNGIDLAIALSHMTETRNTPVALITSLDDGDDGLKLLPDKVPVIHKGATFGDDLAEALSYHFLL